MLRLGLFFLIVVGLLIFLILFFRNRGKDRQDQLLQALYACKGNNYECEALKLMEMMAISAIDLRAVVSTAESKGLVKKYSTTVALTEFGKNHYENFVRSKGSQ